MLANLGEMISIHAPREGSDVSHAPQVGNGFHFYPRSPRGERPGLRAGPLSLQEFLSTLPARGATGLLLPLLLGFRDFYPRSPRGERLKTCSYVAKYVIFLSTLPARGATFVLVVVVQWIFISIHAPREGSDVGAVYVAIVCALFLSTLPARGATANVLKNKRLPSVAFV